MTDSKLTKTTTATIKNANESIAEPVFVREPLSRNVLEKRYQSRALFRGNQEIMIEHAGHTYRLRITRQDKLILTK